MKITTIEVTFFTDEDLEESAQDEVADFLVEEIGKDSKYLIQKVSDKFDMTITAERDEQ